MGKYGKNRKKHGKIWGKLGKVMGKYGKNRKTHGKIWGKLGKVMGKYGKYGENIEQHWKNGEVVVKIGK